MNVEKCRTVVSTVPCTTNNWGQLFYGNRQRTNWGGVRLLVGILVVTVTTGCYAPLHSPAIPACTLPDQFRTPFRTAGPPLNFASLTMRQPLDYLLGANDVLEVTVPGLYTNETTSPIRSQVMSSGELQLPLVGPVAVGGMNLLQAQEAITKAYADGFLKEPRVSISLAQKSTIDIVVLGDVVSPGVYPLPKYQNDVGHAIAAAGGLGRDAGLVVEVHRRVPHTYLRTDRFGLEFSDENPVDPKTILRIPFRNLPSDFLTENDVVLQPGDVVVVPSRKHEVFFVVGKLSSTNLVRFTLGDRERELGTGLILPRDREIDVVTAVTMAGYIDPIDSPTTVTVHRIKPDGTPMLIHVDLIKARYDVRETILVEPGDIIYLNPDAPWYFRRHLDRIVGDLILIPYAKLIRPH